LETIMQILRTLFLTLAAVLLMLPLATGATAEQIFERNGYAIGGADPVAYFTVGEPTRGTPDHAYEWMGATWVFANAEHRDMFAADPVAYAPQYGGWCAWAAARGYSASTIPEAWSVVGGKLYLNYSQGIQRRWEANMDAYIQAADGHWPNIF
jgi:YHS domain-containing protein